MGKNKYEKIKEFLANVEEDKGKVIDFEEFKKEVMIKIGADENRTVKPYIKLMLDLKMISPEEENVRIN